MMLINLQEATQEYWQKLDKLESAYQEGKISIKEVDAEVAFLMAEMTRKRRIAINDFLQIFSMWLTQQRETLIGLGVFGIISSLWFFTNNL